MTTNRAAMPSLRPPAPPAAAPRVLALAALLPLVVAATPAFAWRVSDLGDLSIEELGRIPVTSVSGRPQAVQEAPASIFVITAEDIRRSAATSLAEALRLAPNLQVARLNANQYAISARGFNNAIGNKLLVMVDGRTIYSPLFSGVFWDAQEVPLADVERIEVISGAGGTLWGANAVDGVINVITRSARDTSGWLVSGHAGSTGNAAMVRYGGHLAGGGWRAYALQSDRRHTTRDSGAAVDDHQDRQQAGFRADWGASADRWTLQGDLYQAEGDGKMPSSADMSGANLLARWHHDEADGGNWQLQAWFDQAGRDDAIEIHDHVRTLDLQFNHAPAMGPDQRVIWGLGYRYAVDETDPSLFFGFDPRVRRLRWANVFAQHTSAELTQAIDFGTILAGPTNGAVLPQEADGFGGLKGDDWGFGFGLGLLWKPSDSDRIGINYHSEVKHTIEGDGRFLVPSNIVPLLNGAFTDTGGQADFDTPWYMTASWWHTFDDRLSIGADVSFTHWSSFEQLLIKYSDAAMGPFTRAQEFTWDDSWMYSFGGEYRLNDEWTLRAGVAYDETPTIDATRTPRVPDGSRTWLSVGVGWKPSADWRFDAGFVHLWVDDGSIDHTTSTFNHLSGAFQSSGNVLGVSAQYIF